MFITGLFSVLGLYILLKNIFGKELPAAFGAWAFTFSPAFYYYTINPLPDNFALCCSIWGLALFFIWVKKHRNLMLLLSGIFLSVGTLSKLPFILFYSVPFMYFLLKVIQKGYRNTDVTDALIVFTPAVLPAAWYISVIPHWDYNGIVGGMLDNQASWSTLLDYLQHNLVSTLPELLLNYGAVPYFIAGFYFIFRNRIYHTKLFWVLATWGMLTIMYFLFELNMIAKIHDYYLFPFYPLLFIIVAYGAVSLWELKKPAVKYSVIFLFLILPLTAYLRMKDRWNPDNPGINKDLLVYRDDLRNAVPDNALCITGNDISHFIFFYYVHKKGWGFDEDNLSTAKLDSMIVHGARYLYCDSRVVDQNSGIRSHLEKLVLARGSIKVYKLKRPGEGLKTSNEGITLQPPDSGN